MIFSECGWLDGCALQVDNPHQNALVCFQTKRPFQPSLDDFISPPNFTVHHNVLTTRLSLQSVVRGRHRVSLSDQSASSRGALTMTAEKGPVAGSALSHPKATAL